MDIKDRTNDVKLYNNEIPHSNYELVVSLYERYGQVGMTTRPCEFCAEWDEKYLEEYLTPDTLCGACNGSKVLDIRGCFCFAYEPSECACDADWSDYFYWEDDK